MYRMFLIYSLNVDSNRKDLNCPISSILERRVHLCLTTLWSLDNSH